MGKTILYGPDARNALMRGVDFLARAVASSLGPAGRNTVIYNRHGGAMLTKDGVAIAEAIEAEDLATDADRDRINP
jgi:chaperonin GroEL